MKTNILLLLFVLTISLKAQTTSGTTPGQNEGEYQGHYYDGEASRNGNLKEVFLVYLGTDNWYQFIIHTNGSGRCKGIVSGVIKIVDGDGYFTSDRCSMLNIKFTDGYLDVLTRGCTSLHGLTCQFNGRYIKTNMIEYDLERE